MTGFILDCSVAMAWCFIDEANEHSDRILSLLRESKAIVPSIWSLEITNVLRVGERKNRLTESQSNTFIGLLSALPIEVDMNLDGLPNKNLIEIMRKHSISAYDAAYLELAKRRNLPLATFDKLLKVAANNSGIKLL